MPGRRNRVRSYRFGLVSEALAATYLRCKGYRILARRYKTRLGELDLVARKGRIIAFVEVKARNKPLSEVLQKRQQQRISRAATLFIAKRRQFATFSVRFDVMLIVPWRLPKHIKNAWEFNQ